jgi:hypothetical protein
MVNVIERLKGTKILKNRLPKKGCFVKKKKDCYGLLAIDIK